MKGKETLEMIAKNIEKIKDDPEGIEGLLEYAIDVHLIIDLQNNLPNGFDICLGYGGPNIYWIYSRNYHRLEYYHGQEKEILQLDLEIAEQVLEYLSEIYEYNY